MMTVLIKAILGQRKAHITHIHTTLNAPMAAAQAVMKTLQKEPQLARESRIKTPEPKLQPLQR